MSDLGTALPPAPAAPSRQEHRLSEVSRERLGRLRAEWQLQAMAAERARERFEAAAAQAAQEAAMEGPFELDLQSGVLRTTLHPHRET